MQIIAVIVNNVACWTIIIVMHIINTMIEGALIVDCCHYCSTVHEVPHRLGSIMLCLSNSSLSNTIHHSLAHHHPTAVNNESAFF